MNILGINHVFHDSSAVLLRNGKIEADIEEERINRIKHTTLTPQGATRRCLEIAKMKPEDIDFLAINTGKEYKSRELKDQAIWGILPPPTDPQVALAQDYSI